MLQSTSTGTLNILMIAPQPFFRPRGTPFSVLHRIRALCELGHKVHLICYPFGEDVSIPGLTIQRSARVPFVKDVVIGPSFAKILLDIPLMFATWRAIRSKRFDMVHSHEEAAFFSVPMARHARLLHVYDMHSSLPQQLGNFGAFNIGVFRKAFHGLERYALTRSDGIITICSDLAEIVDHTCPEVPHSMIENTGDDAQIFTDAGGNVRERFGLAGKSVVLYTGTLEHYQGVDILLNGFVAVAERVPAAHLLIVGGTPQQVQTYQQMAEGLGLARRVTFTGQVHPSAIPGFLQTTDLIVSPRSRGTNTPLKIYGYLRSGKPIVATNLPTHTQTLNATVSELVSPTPAGIAKGLTRVLEDKAYGVQLAAAASRLAEREYSDAAYLRRMREFMSSVMAATTRLPIWAATLAYSLPFL
jgi:glycosyltransferase involved in cell wall biosynthesis